MNNNDSKGKAVIFAREASCAQDARVSSIPGQLQTCREYAQSHGFVLEHEIVEQGVSAHTGFQKLVCFLKQHPGTTILVEKTDRLCRNFQHFITMESLTGELGIEVHLVKEGRIVKRGAKSQDKLVQGMYLLLANQYIDNLREEIQKGINEKLKQGVYPGRAPFGYQNNCTKRSIEIHRKTAPIVKRIFKLYATGEDSLPKLQKVLRKSASVRLSTKRLRGILRSPFYTGTFVWNGRKYKGTHQAIVQTKIHQKVQHLFAKSASSVRRTANE